jgi:hypothetical protein
MMAAVVTMFETIGRSVNDSRATIEMTGRLRNARSRLQMDLAGTTCPLRPWTRPESGAGYFEFVEGPYRDAEPSGLLLNPVESLVPVNGLGDYDDVLMFTARSQGEPFVGRLGNATIESQVAEVVWYAVENPADGSLGEPGMRTLYRRVLLVAPWLQTSGMINVAAFDTANNTLSQFQEAYDLSAHLEGTQIVLNTLADLTKRENRFQHTVDFPHAIPNGGQNYTSVPRVDIDGATAIADIRNGSVYSITVENAGSGLTSTPAVVITEGGGTGAVGLAEILDGSVARIVVGLEPFGELTAGISRFGEDVMLTNVLGWDVRVYDPMAPLYDGGDATAVAPSDKGWEDIRTGGGATVLGVGAYVDLGYLRNFEAWQPTRTSVFSSAAHLRSNVSGGLPLTGTYDTWSFHYEHDGINQDESWETDLGLTTQVDQGTDGFDSDGLNGVDDMGERETSPPYPVPLRGIQVRIRVYEPDSRQIREVSIQQSFVPE